MNSKEILTELKQLSSDKYKANVVRMESLKNCASAQDEQEHVKKAASSALKDIGKKDFNYNEKALVVAHEMMQTGSKAQVWIARDAKKRIGASGSGRGQDPPDLCKITNG